jgi:uncharacterized RDD family membrane protein YckC
MSAEQPDHPVIDPIPVEARRFQGQRAGVVTRTIASAVDFAVVVAILSGAYVGVVALRFVLDPTRLSFPSVEPIVMLIAYSVVLFLYLTIFWATTGRTYGGHVMGLRVVNFRGVRVHLAGAILRAAFCTVFPIGLFWCAVSRQNRSVQDVVLRTSVIYDWRPHRNAAEKHDPPPPPPLTPPTPG